MQLVNLTKEDIGKWVEYHRHSKQEIGRIKSWNDKWVFVVYRCDGNWDDFLNYTAAATSPEDLSFSNESIEPESEADNE